MIAAGLTRNFGVIATDSAKYEKGIISFDFPKLCFIGWNYIFSFIGTHLYLKNINQFFFNQPMPDAMELLQNEFRRIRPSVIKQLSEIVDDEEDRKGNFCFFLMGSYNNYPVLCQMNSFDDFNYNIFFSEKEDKVVFSDIYYGDKMDGWKNQVFKESREFMENLMDRYENINQGIVGEILTRGIYYKADAEQNNGNGDGVKYAGGPVTVASISRDGRVRPLSNLNI